MKFLNITFLIMLATGFIQINVLQASKKRKKIDPITPKKIAKKQKQSKPSANHLCIVCKEESTPKHTPLTQLFCCKKVAHVSCAQSHTCQMQTYRDEQQKKWRKKNSELSEIDLQTAPSTTSSPSCSSSSSSAPTGSLTHALTEQHETKIRIDDDSDEKIPHPLEYKTEQLITDSDIQTQFFHTSPIPELEDQALAQAIADSLDNDKKILDKTTVIVECKPTNKNKKSSTQQQPKTTFPLDMNTITIIFSFGTTQELFTILPLVSKEWHKLLISQNGRNLITKLNLTENIDSSTGFLDEKKISLITLSTYKNIKDLILNCSSMTDDSLEKIITHTPHLKSINLNASYAIEDNGIILLAKKLPQLQSINLNHCLNINDIAIMTLAEMCPELASISISRCERITAKGITWLAEKCRQIKHLDLSSLEEVTDAVVSTIAQNCRNLQSINLNYCYNITDAAIIELSEHCPNLKSIELIHDGLTNNALIIMSRNCPELECIKLADCYNVSNDTVMAIAQNCRNLKEIDLDWNDNLTNEGLIALAKNCPQLNSISIAKCKKITPEVITYLAQNCLRLEKIFTTNTTYNKKKLEKIRKKNTTSPSSSSLSK